jgi:hypothetical protein
MIDFRSDVSVGGPGVTTFATNVTFTGSQFSGADVLFGGARFTSGTVDFTSAKFSGGNVDFADVELEGGRIDFHEAIDWSAPPVNLPSSASAVSLPGTGQMAVDEPMQSLKAQDGPRHRMD